MNKQVKASRESLIQSGVLRPAVGALDTGVPLETKKRVLSRVNAIIARRTLVNVGGKK